MSDVMWMRRDAAGFKRLVTLMPRSQPHFKPALLLIALDMMDSGEATPDRVPLAGLADGFRRRLTEVGLPGAENAFRPAWHLATASGTPHPFWELIQGGQLMAGGEPATTGALLGRADAVRFLPELAAELGDPVARIVARDAVLDLLVRDGRPHALRLIDAWPEDQLELRTADEWFSATGRAPFRLDEPEGVQVISERTAIRRDSTFRRRVPAVYEWRCCLCRTRTRWNNLNEVQAAHIKPHALRGTNDVRNGLALCRTHHWAFDTFLWSINDDLSVVVQAAVTTRGDDLAALTRAVEGVGGRLELPMNTELRPHPLALAWHRDRFEHAAGD